MIVQTWFMDEATRRRYGGNCGSGVLGAGMSSFDARFPYITDLIRAHKPSAPYRPVKQPAVADPAIKRMQDKLVALGYLQANYADGLVGRTHSATLDAAKSFQQRNGLAADRDLGGPNSKTRQALDQLHPAA